MPGAKAPGFLDAGEGNFLKALSNSKAKCYTKEVQPQENASAANKRYILLKSVQKGDPILDTAADTRFRQRL